MKIGLLIRWKYRLKLLLKTTHFQTRRRTCSLLISVNVRIIQEHNFPVNIKFRSGVPQVSQHLSSMLHARKLDVRSAALMWRKPSFLKSDVDYWVLGHIFEGLSHRCRVGSCVQLFYLNHFTRCSTWINSIFHVRFSDVFLFVVFCAFHAGEVDIRHFQWKGVYDQLCFRLGC